MESRMLDFPLPFKPVMELKLSSLSTCQQASRCGGARLKPLPSGDDGPHRVGFESLTMSAKRQKMCAHDY